MPVVALSQWLRASDFIGRRKGVTGQSHLHLGALKKDLTRLKATPRIASFGLSGPISSGFDAGLLLRRRRPWPPWAAHMSSVDDKNFGPSETRLEELGMARAQVGLHRADPGHDPGAPFRVHRAAQIVG